MPGLRAWIDASGFKRGASDVVSATERMKRGTRDAARNTDALGRSLRATGQSSEVLAGQVSRLFAIIGGTLAIRRAISTIANFEESMATLRGVTGATGEELQTLQETARRMGATTRFSATEAAEGLLFLARAGFDTTQAVTALPATLNLAQAGMLSLGEAADFASNIVSQFGLSAEQTERVVDTLINTANSANTNVRQLAEALKFAGPIAGSFGISVEQASAAIGALGDSGLQASMAGVNLRSIMLGLTNPTGDAAAAIEKLGLTIEDLNPTTNSLVDIFEKLGNAQLSAAEAGQIFGDRNVAAALILSKSTQKVRELTLANINAAGAAQRLADIQSQTLAGSFKSLLSAVEELSLKVGDDGLLGFFKDIVNTSTDVVRSMAGVEDAVRGVGTEIEIMAAFAKIAGTSLLFLLGGGAIAGGIKTIRALLGGRAGLVALLGGTVGSLAQLPALFDAAAGSSERAARGIESMLSPIEALNEASNQLGEQLLKQKRDRRAGLQGGIETFEALASLDPSVSVPFIGRVGPSGFLPRAQLTQSLNALGAAVPEAVRIFRQLEDEFGVVVENMERKQFRLADASQIFARVAELARKEVARLNDELVSLVETRVTQPAGFIGPLGPNQVIDTGFIGPLPGEPGPSQANNFADVTQQAINDYITSLDRARDATTENINLMSTFGQALGRVFGDAATSLDDLGSVLSRSSNLLLQLFATQAGTSLFSGLFKPTGSAMGNAFQNGALRFLAQGGILSSPTIFPSDGGRRLNVAGEAGDEAVFPLTRKRGRLAVDAVGAFDPRPIVDEIRSLRHELSIVRGDSRGRSRQQLVTDFKRSLIR